MLRLLDFIAALARCILLLQTEWRGLSVGLNLVKICNKDLIRKNFCIVGDGRFIMHIYNRKRWISDSVNFTTRIDGSLSMQTFVIGTDGSVINTHCCLLTNAIERSVRCGHRWAVQKQLD